MTSRNATSPFPRTVAGDDRRARLGDRVAVLAFGAVTWPWLLRSLWGGRQADKQALLARLGLPSDALPHLGSWKADVAFLDLIVAAVAQLRPRNVVELGTGASTLVTAQALSLHGAGQLTTVDQHQEFAGATADWLAEHGLSAEFRAAPLVPAPAPWPGSWYDLRGLPEQIDLLIIDGPPWTVHPLVRGAADSLFDRIPVGGIVLLDDALRPGERLVARRWQRRWPGFRFVLERSGSKGTLVGTRVS